MIPVLSQSASRRRAVISGGGGGGIAIIAHSIGTSVDNNTATTSAVNTTGASLIVVGASSYAGGSVPTVSDSRGNTWTSLPDYADNSGSVARCRLFYCISPSTGAGHTFTVTGASSFPVATMLAVSGSAASPFDAETGTTSGGTSTQPGSITPAVANELFVTICGGGGGSSGFSADSGFTVADSAAFAGGANMGGGMAYLIASDSAAKNPTWTAASGAINAAMAAFKPA